MKLGILSDIHSNLEALTKGLDLLREAEVTEIVCLGDIVGYGANPNECLDLVRQHCSVVLMGNHDQAAVNLEAAEYFTAPARAAAHWTARELTQDHREYLRNLALTGTHRGAFLVHASPLEPGEWHYIFSESDARLAFRQFGEQICFVGHSHVPGIFAEKTGMDEVNRGDRFLVNVGSVGQPRDGDPRLSVGVFNPDRWEYRNIRAEYDAARARRKILDAGLPAILGDRLLRGR